MKLFLKKMLQKFCQNKKCYYLCSVESEGLAKWRFSVVA